MHISIYIYIERERDYIPNKYSRPASSATMLLWMCLNSRHIQLQAVWRLLPDEPEFETSGPVKKKECLLHSMEWLLWKPHRCL